MRGISLRPQLRPARRAFVSSSEHAARHRPFPPRRFSAPLPASVLLFSQATGYRRRHVKILCRQARKRKRPPSLFPMPRLRPDLSFSPCAHSGSERKLRQNAAAPSPPEACPAALRAAFARSYHADFLSKIIFHKLQSATHFKYAAISNRYLTSSFPCARTLPRCPGRTLFPFFCRARKKRFRPSFRAAFSPPVFQSAPPSPPSRRNKKSNGFAPFSRRAERAAPFVTRLATKGKFFQNSPIK